MHKNRLKHIVTTINIFLLMLEINKIMYLLSNRIMNLNVLTLFVFFLGYNTDLFSQGGVGINNDGAMPDANAILDVASTTSGLLMPRMTTAQRDAIAAGSPTTSMMVYITDGTPGFYYYNGSVWIRILRNGDEDNLGNHTATTTLNMDNNAITSINWASSDDGSGSGLDADLLDGITSGSFIRSDANDNVTAHTEWQDNQQIRLGDDADFRIFHNGTDHYFDGYTHGARWRLRAEDAGGTMQNLIDADPDNSIDLYYAGAKKLETTSTGATITGRLQSDYINETSDQRFKKNITTINNALEKTIHLRGVYFDWKHEEFPDRNFETNHNIGLIAQEVETIIPEAVHTNNEGYKSVEYSKLVGLLIEAIKEQEQTIQAQSKHIQLLQKNEKALIEDISILKECFVTYSEKK